MVARWRINYKEGRKEAGRTGGHGYNPLALSTGGSFAPRGHFSCWVTLWVVTTVEEALLLASSGKRL